MAIFFFLLLFFMWSQPWFQSFHHPRRPNFKIHALHTTFLFSNFHLSFAVGCRAQFPDSYPNFKLHALQAALRYAFKLYIDERRKWCLSKSITFEFGLMWHSKYNEWHFNLVNVSKGLCYIYCFVFNGKEIFLLITSIILYYILLVRIN